MKYMCLVYFEDGALEALSEAESVKLTDDTIEANHDLKRRGHLILAQPLQGPETAVTIRVRNGRLSRTDGPFAETKEWLAGFFLIDARDMQQAVSIARESPVAKLGSVEIRPALEQRHSQTRIGRPTL